MTAPSPLLLAAAARRRQEAASVARAEVLVSLVAPDAPAARLVPAEVAAVPTCLERMWRAWDSRRSFRCLPGRSFVVWNGRAL